jgi:hypothetical protein
MVTRLLPNKSRPTFGRNHVMATSRQAAIQQNRQAMIADIEKDIAALNPQPSPEPTIIVEQPSEGSAELGSSDFNADLWKRGRGWWW